MYKESIIIELRSSEGGNDSKLLVKDMLDIYIKSTKNQNFSFKINENRDGFATI